MGTNKEKTGMRGARPDQQPRIWDVPTRVFHWSLVILVAWEWASSHLGHGFMRYHMWGGYAVLTLILFRVSWGFVGSETARFAQFLRSPRNTWGYIRSWGKESHHHIHGHNPLGGWAVIAFLVTLTIQVGTGLFATDDVLTAGPLNALVGGRMGDLLTAIHKGNFDILLALVVSHVIAVILHRVIAGHDLVRPMITGRAARPVPGAISPRAFARPWVSVAALALSGLGTWLILQI
ncbi:cytochrome b/b6 domain-containing protein [Acidiferrobacter sp.]|uniref:cytochrome b/b6 domain-containing protein n=1 Tax=Acidiferrobacter sp. TaxID=1872107 RepID=UPI002616BC5A|nr:cytochrome b/b6 domain-containing protein [Acidiferrobacter sp.]